MKKKSRRTFLRTGLYAGAGAACLGPSCNAKQEISPADTSTNFDDLDAVLREPILKRELFSEPVIIESCELLEYQGNYVCRVRSTDGAEGLCVGHNIRMPHLYPIQLMLVNPFFIGKDARDLDQLIEGVYMYKNNYKYQGYTLWIPVATVEIAILDMLGRIAEKSMGEMIGEIHNTEIAIYQANNNRGKSAEESIASIKRLQSETNAKAVKFKIGGRRNNPEFPAGRTEKLIPLMREAFGEEMTIYADCNGSYDAREAIRIGKILQENRINLFEQPVPTDWYDDWKTTSNALSIPIASGGGEVSIRNFRWLIGHNAVQMVQQDIFYFGGMIRSMKVARMAAARGYPCTPHISGTGLGYIYMMHFVSAIPNAGPFHEYKGQSRDLPFVCETSTLKPEGGILHLPGGIGSGVEIDPDFILKHQVLTI